VLTRRAGKCTDVDEARKQWKRFKKSARVSYRDLRDTLDRHSTYRCYYCDTDDGNAIDHFEAVSRAPSRTFDWANHYLSCQDCNSVFKQYRFDGALGPVVPALLDPFEVEPGGHFVADDEGRLHGLSVPGRQTIYILGLGLNEDGAVERPRPLLRRRDAWRGYQDHIRDYAAAKLTQNQADVARYSRLLQTNACHIVLRSLVQQALLPRGHELYPQVAEAVRLHPEIQVWAGL
jgi:uncharacterized protein (TIGR02646 family)